MRETSSLLSGDQVKSSSQTHYSCSLYSGICLARFCDLGYCSLSDGVTPLVLRAPFGGGEADIVVS